MPRSPFPPRALGKARPTFKLFSGSGFNGVDQLDPSLTINGTTVTPTFRYKGGDADATNFDAWTYGETLPIEENGTNPTFNQGSPCLGTNDDSVLFNTGDYYKADNGSFADVTTEDVVLEFVAKATSSAEFLLEKRLTSAPGFGVFFQSSTIKFRLRETADTTTVSSGLDAGSWYHMICFIDRSGSAQWYINGVASGAAVVVSGESGTVTNATNLTIGSSSVGSLIYSENIAYAAMWQQDAWLDTHLQADIAAERFARLTGVYPAKASGTSLPNIATRSSVATIDKLEDSGTTRKLYQVGNHWLRMCSRLDTNSDEVQGYLSEEFISIVLKQSEDLGTTWAVIDAGDTIGGSVSPPNKITNTTCGIIGDSTNGPHGVSQALSITADTYTLSVWAKQGDQTHLILDDTTIANGAAWFNLSTGALGTIESGVTAVIEDWGDGWYRCSITFTGTVASHTFQIQPADNDNDSSFIGDGATVNIYAWGSQLEINNRASSYVKVTTSTKTRFDDALQYKGDDGNIKDIGKGHAELTILKVPSVDTANDSFMFELTDGGASTDRITLCERAVDDISRLEIRNTTGNEGNIVGSSDISDGIKHKIIASWASNASGLAVDGTQEGSDNLSSVPDAIDEIDVGMNASSVNQFNGLISGLTFFAKALLKGPIGENFMAHLGFVYISSSSAEAVVAGTFEKVAGTYATEITLVDFTHSAGVLTYTGTETKTFLVMAALSCSSSASNPSLRFRMAVNGTSDAASEMDRDMGTSNTVGTIALMHAAELSNGDTVQLMYTDDSSSTLTATQAQLLVVSV